MPQRRTRKGAGGYSALINLQQGRPVGSTWDRAGSLPPPTDCAGGSKCIHPIVPGCPVPLCAKHLREAYVFAQDLIDDRLLPVVAGMIDDL